MHHISFNGPKALQKCLLVLISFKSIIASILNSALSESNIRLSDEGYLVYNSLPDITKAHLFRNYMDEYDREVTFYPILLIHTVCHRHSLNCVFYSCIIFSIQRQARKSQNMIVLNNLWWILIILMQRLRQITAPRCSVSLSSQICLSNSFNLST